jgi:uncharacterized protein
MQLAKEFSVTYLSKVTTNGLALTDAVATELVQECGVNTIEVTLDGTAEYHDARRHMKNGRSTFEKIFTNVVRLAQRTDLKLNLKVRCNVDRRNYAGVSPLIQMLAEAGVQKKLSFYVAPIHSWGNDAHKESLSSEEFAQWEIRWLIELYEAGFKPALLPKRRPIVCFAVSPTSELIDANGDLFNCTEVSYVPKYGNPNEFTIGTVEKGEIPGKRARLADFTLHVRQGEYGCSSCRMLPV